MSTPPFSFIAHRPAAPLSEYVEMLWHAQGQIGYTRDLILPTGQAVLVLNLGAPIRTAGADGDDTVQRQGWVCGIQAGPMLNEPIATTHAVGVLFRPHRAYALLGVPLCELTDHVVALDDLWGAVAEQLRQAVGEQRCATTRLHAAETWLRQRLPTETEPLPLGLDRALHRLCGIPPRSIRQLCHEVGVSHKHFIDRCRRFVGLPPRQIIRVQRLVRTLAAIDPQGPPGWAALAADQGYSDQPHLVREFRRLTGLTPTDYVARRRAVFGDELEAGQIPAFVPVVER